MTQPSFQSFDDETLEQVLASLSQQRLNQLYRLLDKGELGSGTRVETLRRTLVQRLNGSRYQHVRRLWTQTVEHFLVGDPALLYGANRPPFLMHRRDTGALWTGVSTMLIPGRVDAVERDLAEDIARMPVADAVATDRAQAWRESLYKETVSAFKTLLRHMSQRHAFLQLVNQHRRAELREAGITHRVPALTLDDLRQVLILLTSGPILARPIADIHEAGWQQRRLEAGEDVAPPDPQGVVHRAARAGAREIARADQSDQAGAVVPLTALYTWHWPEPTVRATPVLRANGVATLRRGVARYFASHAHAQSHIISQLLPEGVTAVAPTDDQRAAIDRQARRLLEAATAYRSFATDLPRGVRQEVQGELHQRVLLLAKRSTPRLEALIEQDVDSVSAPADHRERVWLFGALASFIVALMVEGRSTRRLRPWRRYMAKRLQFALSRAVDNQVPFRDRLRHAARVYAYARAGGVDTWQWFRTSHTNLLTTVRLGLMDQALGNEDELAVMRAVLDAVAYRYAQLNETRAEARELADFLRSAREVGLCPAGVELPEDRP